MNHVQVSRRSGSEQPDVMQCGLHRSSTRCGAQLRDLPQPRTARGHLNSPGKGSVTRTVEASAKRIRRWLAKRLKCRTLTGRPAGRLSSPDGITLTSTPYDSWAASRPPRGAPRRPQTPQNPRERKPTGLNPPRPPPPPSRHPERTAKPQNHKTSQIPGTATSAPIGPQVTSEEPHLAESPKRACCKRITDSLAASFAW
jgi:hypothetical protein